MHDKGKLNNQYLVMRGSSSLQQSFVANTCFYHPGLLIEAVCLEKSCSYNQFLCCQCIKGGHHTHDLLSLQKYKRVALKSINEAQKVLTWKWDEEESKYRLTQKDKKLLIGFRENMDKVWRKIQEACNIVKHAGDLKIIRKTLKTASQRLEDFVDGKVDGILQKAHQFKENPVIQLSDSEQEQSEKQVKRSREKRNNNEKKNKRINAQQILRQVGKQEEKISKQRAQDRVIQKIAKKAGKSQKNAEKYKRDEGNYQQFIDQRKQKETKIKMEKKKIEKNEESLKIIRSRKPSEDNIQYFTIIDNTKQREREIGQRKLISTIKVPQNNEVNEGQEETQRLIKWYKQNYQDQECRIFAHRINKQKRKEYLMYFGSQFNWVKPELVRGSDFENQMFLYERTIRKRKDISMKNEQK